MGCGSSKPPIIQQAEGDGNDFFDKYVLDRTLGEGEFGVVRLVFDKRDHEKNSSPLACKLLRKGTQFKNNTIYSAIKPKVLRLECKILQTLQGQHHNLRLRGVYESPSTIYLVTDFNQGGDMFHYVSETYKDSGLRVEDISRMSFQLFDAVSHCAKHGIIHRDIKPENIMFKSSEKGSPLCLIDFGSGTISFDEEVQIDSSPKPCKQSNGDVLSLFTTFAGSAFYISPEMFQKCYTCKTDVWSAGVTLYVLAAGYPFKDLQYAFNILQSSKNPSDRIQQIKSLPDMPDMPTAYYELLEKALTFRHTKRMDAASLLNCEFLAYQKQGKSEETLPKNETLGNMDSTVLEGIAVRHKDMHNYTGYEIAVSTLIASVLARNNLKLLLEKIDQVIQSSPECHTEIDGGDHSKKRSLIEMEEFVNKKRLQVLRLKELQSILQDLKFYDVAKMLKEQERDNDYSDYAYHVAKLKQFYTYEDDDVKVSSVGYRGKIDNSMTRKLESAMNARNRQEVAFTKNVNEEQAITEDAVPNSVHGNNVWESIKKQMKKSQYDKTSITRTQSVPDLTNSSHF